MRLGSIISPNTQGMKEILSFTIILTMARTLSRYPAQFIANNLGGVFGTQLMQEGINMLLELSDLKDYADELAKRLPRIAQKVTISEPGTSTDDLSVLDEAIKLPPIYKRCIRDFNLFGVSIGYFSIWPGSIKTANMVEALRSANQGNDLGAI